LFVKVFNDEKQKLQNVGLAAKNEIDNFFRWKNNLLDFRLSDFPFFSKEDKVRCVARLIYERTSRVIGLNVVYLLMFNRHDTTHVRERDRERGREKERERERECVRA